MGAVREAIRARIHVDSAPLLLTTEGGGSATFQVGLKVWPRDTVRVSFVSSDTSEGTVTPDVLTFTMADWEVPRTVTVTGRDDFDHDGDIGYVVTVRSASADLLYDGIDAAAVSLLNSDDETVQGVGFGVESGWNLISLPTVVANADRVVVFPTSVSPAYTYISGYVSEIALRRGAGYWLKFDGDQFMDMAGDTTVAETLAVRPGWNLVGSLTLPVTPAEILSVPPGLTISPYYGYRHGYYAADTIRPGSGYWVKVNGEGILILRSAPAGAGTGTVRTEGDPAPSQKPLRDR